ncbi:hypothetical protein [Bacillus weihaiensis]|uniref:hypothetical protein n=1 Tax=Bacillus weihaiensis TaxID=1547283 RepID=UPI002356C41F|nr:hypothetical protein [Bacillus weihaiensis]
MFKIVKKENTLLLAVIMFITIFSTSFFNTSVASAAQDTIVDDQNASYYFFKGGDARYWKTGTCSLCVNGSYTYTGNTTSTVGNYAYWYYRGFTTEVVDLLANIPNAIGANTTNATYFVTGYGTGYSVNQKAIGGYTRFATNRTINPGGYVELRDRTGEPSGTTNIGFDSMFFNGIK